MLACVFRRFATFALALVAMAACSSAREDAPATADGAADAGRLVTFADDASSAAASCISARAKAGLAPMNLVFMFDQSGSMGDEAHGGALFGFTRAARWDPITSGLKRFFADSASAGLRASLQYFPAATGSCDALLYKTPEVPLTALPNASPFVTSINKHGPLGGTPTLPAVTGALLFAKELKVQFPAERVAVVLVTDGVPGECGYFDEVKARLAADAPEVPTYVVGVGNDLAALADLAKAGGTGSAILVDLQNPQQSTDDFLKALAAIRHQTLSCVMPIPPAPDGKTVDPARVNVALASATGPSDVLSYDATCADPEGWRYDDADAPKAIELCAGSCERARRVAEGSLEVQLGCATKGLK